MADEITIGFDPKSYLPPMYTYVLIRCINDDHIGGLQDVDGGRWRVAMRLPSDAMEDGSDYYAWEEPLAITGAITIYADGHDISGGYFPWDVDRWVSLPHRNTPALPTQTIEGVEYPPTFADPGIAS